MKRIMFLFVLLALYSCNSDNCSKNLGFKLDYHLFDDINVNNKSYCQLVNDALEGNKEAILDLSKVNVSDFASYQHGAVLIEVIDKITLDKYLEIVSTVSDKDKRKLYHTIWAGFEFTTNPKFVNKKIDIAFPKIIELLAPND